MSKYLPWKSSSIEICSRYAWWYFSSKAKEAITADMYHIQSKSAHNIVKCARLAERRLRGVWQIFPTVRWFTIRFLIQKTIGVDGLISFALTIVSQAERTVCHVITWTLIFVLKPPNVGHKEKNCNLSYVQFRRPIKIWKVLSSSWWLDDRILQHRWY